MGFVILKGLICEILLLLYLNSCDKRIVLLNDLLIYNMLFFIFIGMMFLDYYVILFMWVISLENLELFIKVFIFE